MRAPTPLRPDPPTHPRPQLARDAWTDLSGEWEFAFDPDDRGLAERWHRRPEAFDRTIVVPFPPESPASGIGDTSPHPVVWYRTLLPRRPAPPGQRTLLHLGAVDASATVWLDGHLAATHEGGWTPFTVDVTEAMSEARDGTGHAVLVVRAEDRADDVAKPRGKQDWRPEPVGIHTARTTGIWQPVWLEQVPDRALRALTWTPDVARQRIGLSAVRDGRTGPLVLSVVLRLGDEVVAEQTVRSDEARIDLDLTLPAARNGRDERLLWSPEQPTLLAALVRLLDGDEVVDEVTSWVGYRSVGTGGDRFLLNGRAYPLRAVLAQGFWPETHLAAPSDAALRREVELIKELGFNAVRVHQKVEDPRFLHWCDRLGLLVWAELPAAYAFSPDAVERATGEWLQVVRRDAGHACIAAWVPFNESWGVPQLATDPAQQQFVRGLAALTKALDPSRPVIGNDGWEHGDSDLVTVHDYAPTGAELRERYGAALQDTLATGWLLGRRVLLPGAAGVRPVVLSEFGGVGWAPTWDEARDGDWWGYSTADGPEEFTARLRELFSAVHACRGLAGSCYTQLTDVQQETNGLLDAQRRPKLPVALLRALVTGGELPLVPEQPGARRPAVAEPVDLAQ